MPFKPMLEEELAVKKEVRKYNELGIYCYFDDVSQRYDVPFFAKDDVNAKRKMYLDTILNDGNSVLGKFTSDFDLYKVGAFDLETGMIEQFSELVIKGEKMKEVIENKKG